MKNTNKTVFFVSLIIAIIVCVMVVIFFGSLIDKTEGLGKSSFQSAKDAIGNDGEVDDVEGYASIIYGGTGIISIFGSFIFIILVMVTCGMIAFYTILYLISWLIHLKNESKAKMITSIVLIITAIIVQVFFAKILFDLYIIFIKSKTSLVLMISAIMEVFSVAFVTIYYICKRNELIQLYKSFDNNEGGNK